MKPADRTPPPAAGFALIEVLVTIVISAFTLLALAGMQAKSKVAEIEAYQRAQALLLAQDMFSRINANRKNAAAYVLPNSIGSGRACPNPSSTALADVDLCQWQALLDGSAEISGTDKLGGAAGARGCITQTGTRSYLIAVAWQGHNKSIEPTVACGRTDMPTDGTRRAIAIPITIAQLDG